MPLIDDLAVPVPDDEQRAHERRRFLSMLGWGALAAAGAGTLVTTVRYLRPNALYEVASRIKLGPPGAIAVGTVLADPAHKLFVVRTEEGFHAMSATCTHLGCLTRYEAEHKRVFCPCHGSRFDLEGNVTGGPAPRPLPRLKLTVENGVLIVDTKTLVEPDEVLRV